MELTGRVALITGGAVRVGRETALALAARGMRLIIHYKSSQADAEDLRDQIKTQGGECQLVQGDLGIDQDVEKICQQALQYWGEIDLLVNNAAVYYKTPFAELTLNDWDDIMRINLRAPFHCALLLGRAMQARGSGQIINIADWSVTRPYADYLPYCVAKAGLITLTKSLAKALAPQVTVNSVSPGAVMMPDDLPADVRERVVAHTLVKRMGNASDIAEAVCFLAGANFITGTDILVDGGRLIYGT